MLDQNETAGVDIEKEEKMRPFKRALITINALRAAGQLADKNEGADLSSLEEAIEKLLAGEASRETRVEALAAQQHFVKRGATSLD